MKKKQPPAGPTAPPTHLSHEACHHTIFRPFPTPQGWRQWWYLAGAQGFFAGLIDGGANFAIAYAMYHGQDDVRMWILSKNTVAGDLGVTPIIQCAVSMLITSTLVHTDLHNRAIPPMPFVYPHVVHLPDPRILINKVLRTNMATDSTYADGEVWDEKSAKYSPLQKGTFKYYFFMVIRFLFEGNEKNMLAARVGVKNWFGRLLWTAAQGAGLGILFGFPLWCLAVVILGPIYGTGNMGNKWAPQAIKCVYGTILGWYTNPLIATLALGSQSEHHLLVVPVDPEAGGSGTDGEDINTIREEDEHDFAATAQADQPPVGPSSPFPRPFRANTTGHFQLEGQATEDLASPGLSNNLTPRMRTRTRSGSVSVSRPPLTANASYIEQLQSDTTITPQRPRGLTASSYISTTSGSSFAYALGGTGGRAQRRPRANTTTSSRTLPDPSRITPGGSSDMPSPAPSAFLNLPNDSPARSRHNSSPRQQTSQIQDAGPPRLNLPSQLEDARGEGEYDVFGRTERNEVPELTVQRPSTDLSRAPEVRKDSELQNVNEH